MEQLNGGIEEQGNSGIGEGEKGEFVSLLLFICVNSFFVLVEMLEFKLCLINDLIFISS